MQAASSAGRILENLNSMKNGRAAASPQPQHVGGQKQWKAEASQSDQSDAGMEALNSIQGSVGAMGMDVSDMLVRLTDVQNACTRTNDRLDDMRATCSQFAGSVPPCPFLKCLKHDIILWGHMVL